MWKLDPKYSQMTNPLEPLINFGGGILMQQCYPKDGSIYEC